jgi:hypothetical protein
MHVIEPFVREILDNLHVTEDTAQKLARHYSQFRDQFTTWRILEFIKQTALGAIIACTIGIVLLVSYREKISSLELNHSDIAMEPRPRSLFQVYLGKIITILILASVIWALASVMIYWLVPDLTFLHALLNKNN